MINVPASGPKVLPTNPSRNRRGISTMRVVAVPANTANWISEAPSIAASSGDSFPAR